VKEKHALGFPSWNDQAVMAAVQINQTIKPPVLLFWLLASKQQKDPGWEQDGSWRAKSSHVGIRDWQQLFVFRHAA